MEADFKPLIIYAQIYYLIGKVIRNRVIMLVELHVIIATDPDMVNPLAIVITSFGEWLQSW
ncbi:hypothetical protein D3C87_1308210 [compost metagenome]